MEQTHFKQYETVESAILKVVEQEFFEGPFFEALFADQYTMPQIRHFAIQYSFYSRHFPRVLGAAISAMAPKRSWWIPLADNLWDEAGRGVPGKSHEELYRTFLLSVDPDLQFDYEGIPVEPASPAVGKAVNTFIEFFQRATPVESMAAVGLGSELFAGKVMGAIGQGLRHARYNETKSLNTLFWEVHADEHEPRHYQLCREILIQHTSDQDLQTMYEVGREIAVSEAMMYTQLHFEMLSL